MWRPFFRAESEAHADVWPWSQVCKHFNHLEPPQKKTDATSAFFFLFVFLALFGPFYGDENDGIEKSMKS